jgi:hypothetical protein
MERRDHPSIHSLSVNEIFLMDKCDCIQRGIMAFCLFIARQFMGKLGIMKKIINEKINGEGRGTPNLERS